MKATAFRTIRDNQKVKLSYFCQLTEISYCVVGAVVQQMFCYMHLEYCIRLCKKSNHCELIDFLV
jgi:hypothetical protein